MEDGSDDDGMETEELTPRQEEKMSFLTGDTSVPNDIKDLYISKKRQFGIHFRFHKNGLDSLCDDDAQMIADSFDYEGIPYMN